MSRDGALSRRDHDDLAKLVRRQEQVAKTQAKRRAAELRADFEAQLATIFEANDERWRLVTERLEEMTATANAEIKRVCLEEGVRPEFAPSVDLRWYGRGQNMEKERRAELRRVAETRIEALEQKAREEIELRSVEFQARLLGGVLETDSGHALLEAMPKAADLMPPLDAAELDQALPLRSNSGRALPWGGDG
jgi:hypothetical protein